MEEIRNLDIPPKKKWKLRCFGEDYFKKMVSELEETVEDLREKNLNAYEDYDDQYEDELRDLIDDLKKIEDDED